MPLETLATALQASGLSALLRSSIWLYPLVNTGHVVGIALLFGAIVPLDLRLLGCFRRTPLEHLAGTLVPVAITGLVLALCTGSLLFVIGAFLNRNFLRDRIVNRGALRRGGLADRERATREKQKR